MITMEEINHPVVEGAVADRAFVDRNSALIEQSLPTEPNGLPTCGKGS
jgi:hypothetical protein